MGTTAEKINYAINATNDIAEGINNIGGNITQNTELADFREELDKIYNELPKVTGEGTKFSLENTRKGKVISLPEGNCKQETSILPEEYQQVDYIYKENSNAYIDIGLKGNQGTKIIVDIKANNSNRIIGDIANQEKAISIFYRLTNTALQRFGSNYATGILQNYQDLERHIIETSNQGYKVDNELLYEFNSGDFETENNLLLGNYKNADGLGVGQR